MLTESEILQNEEIIPGYSRMTLRVPDIAEAALPGQFVMLKYWKGDLPFFRRPFSINSVDRSAGTMDILYKRVGIGTEMLQEIPAGHQPMEVLGPLGKGFPLRPEMKRIAVVGRGVGAAPMRFLAEEAARMGIRVHAYISAGSPRQLFDKASFEAIGCEWNSSTDDKQKVTAYFARDLEQFSFDAAYVCGSKRLMADVSALMDRFAFEGYVSLEAHMACGIGACKGCVVTAYAPDGTEHYVRVCKDGPVFPLKRMVKP